MNLFTTSDHPDDSLSSSQSSYLAAHRTTHRYIPCLTAASGNAPSGSAAPDSEHPSVLLSLYPTLPRSQQKKPALSNMTQDALAQRGASPATSVDVQFSPHYSSPAFLELAGCFFTAVDYFFSFKFSGSRARRGN